MGIQLNMFNQNDKRKVPRPPSNYNNTTSSQSSSLENKTFHSQESSLFGDPIIPLSNGQMESFDSVDLYENIRNNIMMYNSYKSPKKALKPVSYDINTPSAFSTVSQISNSYSNATQLDSIKNYVNSVKSANIGVDLSYG